MSTVFITGGAGFIGSHLCDHYLKAGWNVIVLDDLSTGRTENLEFAKLSSNFEFVHGDVQDNVCVAKAVQKSDLVVHLAARIGVKLVIQSPLKTLESNVKGTEVVLRHAADRGVRTLIASTSEVYGLTERYPSHEDDPVVFGSPAIGRWSYACSKAYDESLALAYYRELKLPATVVRLFNTVGPRQSAHYGMVMPRFVLQALLGEPLTVYGEGMQTRCFAHVDDVIKALSDLAGAARAVGEVVNIGNPQEIKIIDLAQKVIDAVGSSSTIEFIPFAEAYGEKFEEIMRRVPDIKKAQSLIGFEPRATVDNVIHDLIVSQRSQAPTVVPL